MAGMTADTDVEEFIELFEVYEGELQLGPECWLNFFRPLLNDKCRDAMMGLPLQDRADYHTVRDHIIDQCGVRHTRLGDTFWCFQRARGQTFAQAKRKLLHLFELFRQGQTDQSRSTRRNPIQRNLSKILPPSGRYTSEG